MNRIAGKWIILAILVIVVIIPLVVTNKYYMNILIMSGIVVKGWRESTPFTAEEVLVSLEPYCSGFLCTYVDKEGMLQGTDLGWFRRLRAATTLEITAAGGITTLEEVRALLAMNVHAALGMAVYTGRLSLEDLAQLIH